MSDHGHIEVTEPTTDETHCGYTTEDDEVCDQNADFVIRWAGSMKRTLACRAHATFATQHFLDQIADFDCWDAKQ